MTDVLCGVIGVALLGLVVYAGFSGVQVPMANFASEFVFVVFWTGLVGVSVLFGDIFRAFNPWRALGRFVAWISQTAAGGEMPAPLEVPRAAGLLPGGGRPVRVHHARARGRRGQHAQNVAIAALVYSAATFVGMALYGVDTWIRKGEAFSVYFNLFSRIGPWTTRDGQVGLRRPLSGLAAWEPLPGAVLLLAVMIGTVTFDGAAEAPIWTGIAPDIQDVFVSLGLSPEKGAGGRVLRRRSAWRSALVYGFYRLGIAGAHSVGGDLSARELADAFVHSLVPIAFAYVAAHYLTQLLYQGQSMIFLVSNPLGKDGTDFFGTADRAVDYGVIGATTAWYYQVGLRGRRPRGGADPGPRPGARHLRRRPPGRALAVLDAGDHGRLHQPGPLAPRPVERMSRC